MSETPNAPDSPEPPPSSPERSGLARIEELLGQIRDRMDADGRETQHAEFTGARLAGSVAGAIVIGLLLWALSDCIFQQREWVLEKLFFAIALQLIALTAMVIDAQRK